MNKIQCKYINAYNVYNSCNIMWVIFSMFFCVVYNQYCSYVALQLLDVTLYIDRIRFVLDLTVEISVHDTCVAYGYCKSDLKPTKLKQQF